MSHCCNEDTAVTLQHEPSITDGDKWVLFSELFLFAILASVILDEPV